MPRSYSTAFFILVLLFAFVFMTTAQESQKAPKQEMKSELTKAPTEHAALKSVSCGPECGFMVKSRNEKELVSIVKQHVKTVHNKTVTDKDVRAMMKSE